MAFEGYEIEKVEPSTRDGTTYAFSRNEVLSFSVIFKTKDSWDISPGSETDSSVIDSVVRKALASGIIRP